MYSFYRFFDVNSDILYLIYGQVFVLMGFAVILKSRRYSQSELAKHAWMLGSFGVLHGVVEWGNVYIPARIGMLSEHTVNLLSFGQTLLLATSFYFLFLFGSYLVAAKRPRLSAIVYAPHLSLAAWTFWLIFVAPLSGEPLQELTKQGDLLARFGIAMPGAFLTTIGLLRQASTARRSGMPQIARHLLGAAIFLVIHCAIGEIIFTDATVILAASPSFILDWLGSLLPVYYLDLFRFSRALDAPLLLFRATAGAGIAFCVVRAMEIFEIETDQLIKKMMRERSLAEERERIGRELHDGIIQSLYASGLVLDDTYYTIGEDPDQARKKVQKVMRNLDDAIRDIRNYIFNLRTLADHLTLEEQIAILVKEFRVNTLTGAVTVVSGDAPVTPSPFVVLNLVQCTREALANIAQYAYASRVRVALTYYPTYLRLEISDNGVGFDPHRCKEQDALRGNGLKSMKERAYQVGGSMRLWSEPGKGARLTMLLPYDASGDRSSSDNRTTSVAAIGGNGERETANTSS